MTGLQAHNKAVRMIRASLPADLVVTRSMGWLYGAIECYDAVRIGNDINKPGVKSKSEPSANMTYGKTIGTIADVPLGRDYKGLIRFARSAAQNYYIHNHIPAAGNSSSATARCLGSSTGSMRPVTRRGRWEIWKWPLAPTVWWICGAARPSRWRRARSRSQCLRTACG